jgi:hypothetical protein
MREYTLVGGVVALHNCRDGPACLATLAFNESETGNAVLNQVGVEALAHLALHVGEHILANNGLDLLGLEDTLECELSLRIERAGNTQLGVEV